MLPGIGAGVTTGPVTVPLVLAMGLGFGNSVNGVGRFRHSFNGLHRANPECAGNRRLGAVAGPQGKAADAE